VKTPKLIAEALGKESSSAMSTAAVKEQS